MAASRTRGQPGATAAVAAFVAGGPPHAVLLAGPPSVGKTTLALDLASALLCRAEDPADRPCGECRGCRRVASGNHPDLHRLAPEGPGAQIKIGASENPDPGTIRWLISELALLPMEGGARVAILEHAERLNEAAQQALLKTLEEPPAGVTIVLCADDEERLLPTVRSRCARVRLGPVPGRDIEGILGDLELTDAPTAARLARLADGRPGLAVTYARAPEAVTIRGEVARALLDLLGAGPADRLRVIRELLAQAAAATAALAQATASATAAPAAARGRGRERGARTAVPPGTPKPAAAPEPDSEAPVDPGEEGEAAPAKRSAAERRRAAVWLIGVWRDVCRDLAVLGMGERHVVRDPTLLEELEVAAGRLDPGAAAAFLERLARVGEQLDANVSPELAVDVLALAWPRSRVAA